MQSNFRYLAMIQQGYYATYPLLFISVVCLAIIFERVWALWGVGPKTAKLADSLIPLLRRASSTKRCRRRRRAGRRPSESFTL